MTNREKAIKEIIQYFNQKYGKVLGTNTVAVAEFALEEETESGLVLPEGTNAKSIGGFTYDTAYVVLGITPDLKGELEVGDRVLPLCFMERRKTEINGPEYTFLNYASVNFVERKGNCIIGTLPYSSLSVTLNMPGIVSVVGPEANA